MAAEYFSRDGGRELEAGHPVGKGERNERGPARKKPEAEATRAKMTTARGDGATAAEADGLQRRRRGGSGGRREGAGGRQRGGCNRPLLWVEVTRSSPHPLGANAGGKPKSTSARHTQHGRTGQDCDALIHRSSGAVWTAVSGCSALFGATPDCSALLSAVQDGVGAAKERERGRETRKRKEKKMPSSAGRCGSVRFGAVCGCPVLSVLVRGATRYCPVLSGAVRR